MKFTAYVLAAVLFLSPGGALRANTYGSVASQLQDSESRRG